MKRMRKGRWGEGRERGRDNSSNSLDVPVTRVVCI